MRVVIDHDRCTGHGRCYVVAAALFRDDDAGFGQVIGDGTVGGGRADEAQRAVLACPEQAVTIEGGP